MSAIIGGTHKSIEASSYAVDVGQWRRSSGNWNFTDDGGAQGTFTIFTVTGDVMMQVFGLCQTDLDSGGAATVALGITGNVASLIAQTTATDIDQYNTWQDGVPEARPGNVGAAMGKFFVISNGDDVILTVATADLTAGDLDLHAFWLPLSDDGNVVAA